ncbi:MAG TPA: helix-turn-helix transcriptional regulator [Vicinamibacterales bacterium]|nr:helix-turn-helix transcriptional regulator [Vicinamibacterales bacterium]
MRKVRLPQLQTQRVAANKSVTQLAQAACVPDRLIQALESPHPHIPGATSGTTEEHVAQRIADALGVTLTTLGVVRL